MTQWGSSWWMERVAGDVGFERIVEICGKVKDSHALAAQGPTDAPELRGHAAR